MRAPSAKLIVAFALGSLLLAVPAGCAQSQSRKWYDPFGLFAKQDEPGPPKVMSSVERIKILRELADRAPKLTPEQQEKASTEIAQALSNEDDTLVRGQMLRTIAVMPTRTASTMLAAGLQDADRDVRVACCEAWGKRGGDDAVKLMVETLRSDGDVDVRLAAARALGELKDPKAVEALGAALDDQDPAIQYRSIESLRKITGKSYSSIQDWRLYVQGKEPEPPSVAERLRQLF
ncbi:MAG TPA: HEAT repeat domain-containing protein [Pirellulales bacterium]|jgi:HEAT repeat protein|nr:HEAT repeat domain-containing protein [Pirellulales bacterium]